MKLKNLSSLSHEKINRAILQDKQLAPHLLTTHHNINQSPFERLARLLSDKADQNLSILCILLGGSQNNVPDLLRKRADLVMASKIFLKFKIEGENYRSKHGKNNSCLHDALDCGNSIFNLVSLLLKHGADPDKENDDHLSPLALHFQQLDKNDTSLNAADMRSEQKIINYIGKKMMNSDPMSLQLLRRAGIFHFFKKHPDLINFRCEKFYETDEHLLHIAVYHHSLEVLQLMLRLGARTELGNSEQLKPIDCAARILMSGKTHSQKKYLEMIALLLLKSIPKQLEMPCILIESLLGLDLNDEYRKIIGQRFLDLASPCLTEDKKKQILSGLNTGLELVKHRDISLIKKIGSGSYGTVYLAKQYTTPLAVKLSNKPMGYYHLRIEAMIHSHLSHPNIIEFQSTIEYNGFFGIVMECACCSLASLLYSTNTKADNNILASCFYPFIKQMHAALKYIHQLGLVHLDFKPANILAIPNHDEKLVNMTLKLADFGGSSFVGEQKYTPVTTCEYCSPEGFTESPYTIGNDTFSLGTVIGEMETGEVPWRELYSEFDFSKLTKTERRANMSKIIKQNLSEGKYTSFNKKEMQPKVAHLVKWCWQPKPEHRPNDLQIEEYIENHFK